MKNCKTIITGAVLCLALSAMAENWGQWRGPNFNGSTSEKNLPGKFSKSENLAWTLDLPGPSAATPAVWDDWVFVSSGDKTGQKMVAFCIDRINGKVLWKKDVAQGYRRDSKSNFASPSPATDGKRVIFFFSTGDLVAYDFSGKQLWTRNIQKEYGEFAFNWTFSTSPVLYDGKLYMQVLQRDVPVNGRGRTDGPNDRYLLALGPRAGTVLSRQLRPRDAVPASREAFGT